MRSATQVLPSVVIAAAAGCFRTSWALSEAMSVATFVNGGSGEAVNGNVAIVLSPTETTTLPLIAFDGTTNSISAGDLEMIVARMVPVVVRNETVSDEASSPEPAITTRAPRGADDGINSLAVGSARRDETEMKVSATEQMDRNICSPCYEGVMRRRVS